MRNSSLHALLRAHVEAAGAALAGDAAGGAEVPFEVREEPGRRTPLYCYRPLTGRFIEERSERLSALETALPARRALERLPGLDGYLRRRGHAGPIPPDRAGRAAAALERFLGAAYESSTDFAYAPERFARAYEELEAAAYAGRSTAVVLAPVLGLAIESDELALGDGLALVRGRARPDAPREAVWSGGETPNVLIELEVEERPGGPGAVSLARRRFARLLTALRLFGDGWVALGSVAWARLDTGPWRLEALGASGRPRGTLLVTRAQEDELRAFASLVSRRTPPRGELAWALARFELGGERLAPFEALTDYLLALRALLEPEGPASGRLAGRVAALCAHRPDRPALAGRVARAIVLERAVIAGLAPADAEADTLVDELCAHLRALLRDTLCGHLEADLVGLADELLAEPVPAPA